MPGKYNFYEAGRRGGRAFAVLKEAYEFRLQRFDELYAEVPAIQCKGLCTDSCGIICLQQTEYSRIREFAGDVPEADDGDLCCPFLTSEDRCAVHVVRPLICRLWGVVPEMPCPHGCEVERMLTSEEGRALIQRAIAIDPVVYSLSKWFARIASGRKGAKTKHGRR